MSQHCQETLSLFSGVGSFDQYPCNNIEALNVVPIYWCAVITSVKCKHSQSPPPPHIISFIIRSKPGKCDVHCSHTLLYIDTTLSQKSFSFGKRLLSSYMSIRALLSTLDPHTPRRSCVVDRNLKVDSGPAPTKSDVVSSNIVRFWWNLKPSFFIHILLEWEVAFSYLIWFKNWSMYFKNVLDDYSEISVTTHWKPPSVGF